MLRAFKVVLVFVFILAAGCSSVRTRKVPHPPSYSLAAACTGDKAAPCWNELRREADKIEGTRYYLPRPYVAAKQSFPVGGGTFFVRVRVEGDQLRAIDSVPEALAPFFPGDELGGISRLKKEGASPRSESRPAAAESTKVESESTDGGEDGEKGGGKAEQPAPQLLADTKDLLKGSTVSHQNVPSAEQVVTLTIKVSKDLETSGLFGDEPELDGTKVFLVPVQKGKHLASGVVTVEGASTVGSVGRERLITALVQGSKMPAFASLAVAVKGKKDDKTETLLLHRKSIDIVSSFAESGKKEGEEEKSKEEKKTDQKKKLSEATATISGDPSTEPLIEISELYDVLLLPDFSQQYAIQVRSGLFKASADIGLENGWMAEKINTEIDNSQLGEFVLSSAGKLVDAALGKYFPQLEVVEAAEEQPDATELEVTQESERRAKDGKPLIVRIDYVQLATSGLHPVVKIEEQACGNKVEGPHSCWPRVEWRTQDRLVMTLVGLKDEPPASGTSRSAGDSCDVKDFAVLTETYSSAPQIVEMFKNRVVTITGVDTPSNTTIVLTIPKASLRSLDQVEQNLEGLKDAFLDALNAEFGKRDCDQVLDQIKLHLVGPANPE